MEAELIVDSGGDASTVLGLNALLYHPIVSIPLLLLYLVDIVTDVIAIAPFIPFATLSCPDLEVPRTGLCTRLNRVECEPTVNSMKRLINDTSIASSTVFSENPSSLFGFFSTFTPPSFELGKLDRSTGVFDKIEFDVLADPDWDISREIGVSGWLGPGENETFLEVYSNLSSLPFPDGFDKGVTSDLSFGAAKFVVNASFMLLTCRTVSSEDASDLCLTTNVFLADQFSRGTAGARGEILIPMPEILLPESTPCSAQYAALYNALAIVTLTCLVYVIVVSIYGVLRAERALTLAQLLVERVTYGCGSRERREEFMKELESQLDERRGFSLVAGSAGLAEVVLDIASAYVIVMSFVLLSGNRRFEVPEFAQLQTFFFVSLFTSIAAAAILATRILYRIKLKGNGFCFVAALLLACAPTAFFLYWIGSLLGFGQAGSSIGSGLNSSFSSQVVFGLSGCLFLYTFIYFSCMEELATSKEEQGEEEDS